MTARLAYMQEARWTKNFKAGLGHNIPIELPLPDSATLLDITEPDLLDSPKVDFLEMIELRTSGRKYDQNQQLTLKELSFLLWCSQGVKMVMNNKTIRNVPSAGGKHALETILLIHRVEGLEPGLYRFVPIEHKLILLSTNKELCDIIPSFFSTNKLLENAAVVFLWEAIFDRMAERYGERSFRYVHLDAGHACQNLYLAGQVSGIKVCALGAFDDDELNYTLGLDGDHRFIVYGASVGK